MINLRLKKLENANLSTFRQIVQKLCKHSILTGYNIFPKKWGVLRQTAELYG